jgi:hypothetical protein
MEHGLAGLDEGGKVENAVKGFSLVFGRGEDIFKPGPVCQLTLDEFHSSREKVAPAMAQVVKNDDLGPIFGQQSRDCTTDVPRTSCYQYLHKKRSLPKRIGIA